MAFIAAAPPKNLDAAFAQVDVAGVGSLDGSGVHACISMVAAKSKIPCPPGIEGFQRVSTLLPLYDANADGRLTLGECRKLHSYLKKGEEVKR